MLHTLQLSLLHVQFIQLDNSWHYEDIISPFSRLYFVTGGEGFVYHHGNKYVLKPGHMYLIPAFTYSQYHCDHYLEKYYVNIVDEMEGGYSVFDLVPLTYEVAARPMDQKLIERLLELYPNRYLSNADPAVYDNRLELHQFDHPSQLKAAQELLEGKGLLLQLFSRFLKSPSTKESQSTKPSHHRLSTVIAHMRQHLAQEMTVAYLAEIAHLSPDYFSRLFLEVMGARPLDYLHTKRLERAQLLLTITDAPLQEIAVKCGIPNLSYFSRLFKRHFGMAPGAYRKMKWRV